MTSIIFTQSIPSDLDTSKVPLVGEFRKRAETLFVYHVQALAQVRRDSKDPQWEWVNIDYYDIDKFDSINMMMGYVLDAIHRMIHTKQFPYHLKSHFRLYYRDQSFYWEDMMKFIDHDSKEYVPDYSSDTKETIEAEFGVKIIDQSKGERQYVLVKKEMTKTIDMLSLKLLFEHDLRSVINRYADCKGITLHCYHESVVFHQNEVELLAHTTNCCSPENIIAKHAPGIEVPEELKGKNLCINCGNLTENEVYCNSCFNVLDHNTVAANLRETKRALEVAAYHGEKEQVSDMLMAAIAKALECTIQIIQDINELQEINAAAGGPGQGMILGKESSPDWESMEIPEPNVICAWCKTVLKETSSTLVSHGICSDCESKAVGEAI